MDKSLTVAALQLALGGNADTNIAAVSEQVRAAAGAGANIILPPELFDGPYFCKNQDEAVFARAHPVDSHPTVAAMRALAAELGIVIPTSIFERDGPHYYNSLVMVGADGGIVGTYRKSHIPDGPGYQEKFYFRPGNSGFRVWDVAGVRVGVGICWDQWYPECARALALMGADLLLYPTAIGAEPHDPNLDTRLPWRRVMVGHAVANVMPVIAANRVGIEDGQAFYGTSFITDEWGDVLADMDDAQTGFIIATLDLARAARNRAGMGFFRDRRPELYRRLVEDI